MPSRFLWPCHWLQLSEPSRESLCRCGEGGLYCLFSDHHLFVPSAGWVLSMWKFKAELKQTYFVSATSNHLPDQGGVLMCFVCTWTGCFICKQPRMIVCVSLFELKLFRPPTPLPPISRSLYCCNLVLVFSLLASRIFSKGGTMFIFRHFPLTAVNPREGHLLVSLNCSARCLFTLLKSPISHLGPHFFIGTVFGQASQVTMVSLF